MWCNVLLDDLHRRMERVPGKNTMITQEFVDGIHDKMVPYLIQMCFVSLTKLVQLSATLGFVYLPWLDSDPGGIGEHPPRSANFKAREFCEQVGLPLELDTDGIWSGGTRGFKSPGSPEILVMKITIFRLEGGVNPKRSTDFSLSVWSLPHRNANWWWNWKYVEAVWPYVLNRFVNLQCSQLQNSGASSRVRRLNMWKLCIHLLSELDFGMFGECAPHLHLCTDLITFMSVINKKGACPASQYSSTS